eukprot:4865223-Pleurochrysis_carterae.AAC.5
MAETDVGIANADGRTWRHALRTTAQGSQRNARVRRSQRAACTTDAASRAHRHSCCPRSMKSPCAGRRRSSAR